ncbi:MAG: C4-dicarboxylate ABC transporter substrate-binding protein [Acidobacteria bacterium RIFCSPLOWO2_02_FULL_65_29]|nr:MAG: C4-dicarboxylate ABC transporter substrate-binding protein [Acidobacteria bacterium RIFCSPLOWO2_02_FULL_65_29]
MFKRALFAAACAVALGAGPAAAQQLRIASNFPTQHTSSVAMEQFKSEVEAATKKELAVDLFPAMQLGGAQENVDQTRSGAIFGTVIGAAFLSRTVPEISALSVPFLFTSRQQAFKVVDGKVGALIAQRLSDKGFLHLGFMELGSRNLTNNTRPIKTLADFKGLKIRLQPDDIHLATFRALGANPVAMDIKEVYSALQQGVLDGQENPYAVIRDRNFNQVQKYLTGTGHFFDFIVIVANKKRFDGLKPEQQKAIRGAMGKAVAKQRVDAEKADTESRDELKKRGMQFEAPSPQLVAEMRKATAGVVDLLKKKVDPKLVDEVLASAK